MTKQSSDPPAEGGSPSSSIPPGRAQPVRSRSPLPSQAPRRRRVLVVDDSAICLEVAREMLDEGGYDVITLDSPFGLGSALAREEPDLVLVDVSMPGLSGDKLVEIALRNQQGSRRFRIVLFSDRPRHELQTLADRCGAVGFIQKSADKRAFLREIEVFMPA